MTLAIDEALLGRDIYVPDDEDADLRITPSGDLGLASGRDALRADLRRRIVTTPGELTHRPEYGAGAGLYIETAASPSQRAQLANDIRRNCLRDSRLKDCKASVSEGVPFVETSYPYTVTVELEIELAQSGQDQMTVSISE